MAAPITTGRWAVILETDDGVDTISEIKLMEGGALPELRDDQKEGGSGLGYYSHEQVEDGVRIKMIRGGPVGAVGGWGFPEGWTGEVSETGATDMAATGDKPAGHYVAKSRGTAPPEKAKAEPAQRPGAKMAEAEAEQARTATRKAADAEAASSKAKMAEDTQRHSSSSHVARSTFTPLASHSTAPATKGYAPKTAKK